ncbi:MAG: hypothetical protein AAF871_13935 [Pseudomonadota bacterium]
MLRGLAWLGARGQYCLIAGLFAGLALPDLAEALRPWIGAMIVLLLVLTGIRVGAQAAIGSLDEIWNTLARVGLLQLLMPLGALAVFSVTGLMQWPLALAVVLMLSAPSVTGAPNFAMMVKQDPAPGMRILVLSTLIFPITALPLLLVLDLTGEGGGGALLLALGLLAPILAAVGVGFAVRARHPKLGEAYAKTVLEGIAAFLLGIVVVGLMSAIGPLLRSNPSALAIWIVIVLVINFGLVIGTFGFLQRRNAEMSVATAIYAGNRNIALFLIVLPENVAAPLLIFIGCYQIPMYLTPFLISRLPPLYHR